MLLIIQRELEGSDASLGFALSLAYFTKRHAVPLKISPRTNLFILRLEDPELIVHTDPESLAVPGMEIREALGDRREVPSGLYAYRWRGQDKIAYVVGRDGLLFGISLFRTDLLAELYRAYRFLIAVSTASALAFVAMALFIARSISRPVLGLAEAAGKIAARNYSVRVKLEGGDEMELLGRAFNQMADDIQAFTGNLERLVAERTEALEQKIRQVEELSATDPLTGIFNRKRLNEELAIEIERVKRYAGFMALIMFDIDHFKEINDAHGHAVGDSVLVELVSVVKGLIRRADVFSRWGGEEFLILLPETDLEGAQKMAEKLRVSIETNKFTGVPIVTCSFGVAAFTEIDDEDTLLKRADDALYDAKNSGRNRVAVG
jgi:diguanylate cyclase (GGDEF)-like protein